MVDKVLDGDVLAARFRKLAIDLEGKKLLMTSFSNSKQESDLSLPINCRGFGRVHRFKHIQDSNWVPNPLPAFPASDFLSIEPAEVLLSQVFQLSVCNWRC